MAAPKIQILGHSYVTRLKHFIARSEKLQFDFGFQVKHLVQYSGMPGAKVTTLRRNLGAVSDFEPDILFLVIGTNDLYDPANTPESVSASILDLVDTLLFMENVKYVIVCQVFHRTPTRHTRYPVDLDWFNSRVDRTNILLNNAIDDLPLNKVKFWRCKGFWSIEAQSLAFSEDGVHLSGHGQQKFYANIRAALVATFNKSFSA